MGGSLTLGHVRGIPIRAHFTLLLVLPYLAFLMAARFAAVARVAQVTAESMLLPPLAWGGILAVLLFACVLLHELGHALVAVGAGGKVSSITLMLLGGVSELKQLPTKPAVEARVAAAGPLVSLGLGALALLLHAVLRAPDDVRFGLYYLGQINLVLGVFNLLPAFPMDGGRLLRALLAMRLARVRATRVAAITGKVFAVLFVGLGLLGGNLVLALIGAFVWMGAQAERSQVEQESEWGGLRVRDVMRPVEGAVEAWRPATEAASIMAAGHVTALPVVENGQLVGVVALRHLLRLEPGERELTPVGRIAARDVPRLQADESLIGALEQLAERDAAEAPVLDGVRLVGVLEPGDLGRTLKLRKLATHAPSRVSAPPPIDDRPMPCDPFGANP